MTQTHTKKKALVLVSTGSEELETTTVLDVLSRGEIETTLAAVDAGENRIVTCGRGVRLQADVMLSDVSDAAALEHDILVLPGGMQGAETFRDSAHVQRLIAAFASAEKFVAAICAAPIALTSTFKGKRATAHPCVKDVLEGTMSYSDAEPCVRDGRLITSRGPGTALAFALAIVEALQGASVRRHVAEPMLVA